MKLQKKHWGAAFIVFLILCSAGFVSIHYYSFIFARTISGKILHVERVNNHGAKVTFAVSIQDKASGEILTSMTTDRQWAVVNSQYCAKVHFFRYPPWDYEHTESYFGARLKKLFECEPTRS